YGSLYQWGRLSDGHELINWSSPTVGTPVNTSTSTKATTNTPTSASFITSSSDWLVPKNNALWQGEAGTNNPCPVGYRVPTFEEQRIWVRDARITNITKAASSTLGLTAAGLRSDTTAELSNSGSIGYYITSSVNGSNVFYRLFLTSVVTSSSSRAKGASVRCIKN
ncbi:MAG: hypothetical protein ACWIPJ_05490, partial [Polaribacter sp.]